MKLSRKWAKTAILFAWCGLGIFIIATILLMISPEYIYLKISIMIFGTILSCFSLMLLIIKCRCPYCGKSVVLPRWNEEKKIFCSNCAKELEYDSNE